MTYIFFSEKNTPQQYDGYHLTFQNEIYISKFVKKTFKGTKYQIQNDRRP